MEESLARICLGLVESLPIGVVVWRLDDLADDASLRLVGFNRVAGRWLEKLDPLAVGKRMPEIFTTTTPEQWRVYADVVRSGATESVELAPTGYLETSYAVTAVPIADQCVALLLENLTIRRKQEDEIRRLNAFMSAIVENMPAMVFVKDARDLRFELFNRSGEKLLGLPRQNFIGKTDHDFFPPEQADFFQARDREVLRDGVLLEIAEEPIETAKGRRWLNTRKIPILDEKGDPQHLLGISLDITERRDGDARLRAAHDELKRQAQVIERMATTDDLTGLNNRRGFVALAEQHSNIAKRGAQPFAILFVDLDGLKKINDTLGHDVGDQAIRRLGTVLASSIREADILGRLGGDEFVLLLHDATPPAVDLVIERIRERLSNESALPPTMDPFSVSIGTAFNTPEHPRPIAELLAEADKHMYEDKRRRSTPKR